MPSGLVMPYPGTTEPQNTIAQQTSPTKLSNFLLWKEGSARFLPRTRSHSVQKPLHPLQSNLQPSQSTPDLTAMAVGAATSQPSQPKIYPPGPELLNTLPDPRTPSSASTVSRSDSVVDGYHPDLNDEISKLNDKLVDSINHQVNLDDALQQSRHELEIARRRLEKLEGESKEHTEQINSGVLVSGLDSERRVEKYRLEATTEKEARLKAEKDKIKAEKDKKGMEQELETLTTALFQEANTMVADARKEKEASNKRIEQLKTQLRDSEVLLTSHQEQLADLKVVLEKMVADRADGESVTNNSSNAPSSPAVPATDRMSKTFEAGSFPQADETASEATPEHPLHFSHIIQPVLRTDVIAYQDFAALIKQARAASPPSSRVVSGSYSSLSAVSNATSSAPPPQNPSPTIPGSFPTNNGNSITINKTVAPPPPTLRETKVFKRALTEDIDPTLRLDIAPGVSWISRRPIVNSMIDGSLAVEPMPTPPIKFRGPVNPCALCGENRVGETYARKHRFRISENTETRFPLCDLCLGRLRSCCDLLSFLRMVTGGHWRAESDDEIKAAWDEYVKLRERMFWHRVSGGVVPVCQSQSKDCVSSPRHSISSVPEQSV